MFPIENVLLSVEEMYQADKGAVAAGITSETLMENAGIAITASIVERWAIRPITILCGPGNNGGDGFVVARRLKNAGWPVTVALLGNIDALNGDAKINANRWNGDINPLSPAVLNNTELVVDALFGAGLARDICGSARDVIEALGDRPVVSVDIPSGIHGDSGKVLGIAPRACLTITFFRRKPGHLLLPGRSYCGETLLVDIGIPDAVLSDIKPARAMNNPRLWVDRFPWPRLEEHKYSRGHAVVTGGQHMTGAAQLAARSAQRVGAGLVTAIVPSEALLVYKVTLSSVMVHAFLDNDSFAEFIGERRITACLVGPGNGVSSSTRELALAALRSGKPVVLDADALTVFEDTTSMLNDAISGPCVLTPHDGEFTRLFDTSGDKVARVRRAAAHSGSVVVLKGADTVIAAPDGRAVINENAPPDLATGGSGDVLAGFVTGLMAQGQSPFDAACTAVWLHGAAAAAFGPGLVADDIIETLPVVLRQLQLS